MFRRRFIGGSLALGAASVLPRVVTAQAYPTKPVKLLVGYPPGGFPDTMARVITPKLSDALVSKNTRTVCSNAAMSLRGPRKVMSSP